MLIIGKLASIHQLLSNIAESRIARPNRLHRHRAPRVQATLRELVPGVRLHVRDEWRLREASVSVERTCVHV